MYWIIKDISKNFCCIESCLKLSSDHSYVIFTNMSKQNGHFQKLLKTTLDNCIPLKTDITRAV